MTWIVLSTSYTVDTFHRIGGHFSESWGVFPLQAAVLIISLKLRITNSFVKRTIGILSRPVAVLESRLLINIEYFRAVKNINV